MNILKHNFFVMELLSLLLLFLTKAQHAQAADLSRDCSKVLTPSTVEAIARLKKSDSIQIKPINCLRSAEINELVTEKIFFTYGRDRRRITLCISDDISNPCKISIGEIDPVQNPNKVLSEAFGVVSEIDLSKPIEESIERILIKPSGEILPPKGKER